MGRRVRHEPGQTKLTDAQYAEMIEKIKAALILILVKMA